MDIPLSWDLVVIIVFSFVIAYSYIVGINKTMKIIIATYLASIAADSLGNLFKEFFLSSDAFVKALSLFNLQDTDETLIIAKVGIFSLAIVIIVIKGAFDVTFSRDLRSSLQAPITGLFGFLCGGLMISSLLYYLSGRSFTGAGVLTNINSLYTDSSLVRLMIDGYNFWFSLPVVAVIIWSIFMGRRNEA